jgi:hypothetical protein
MSDSQRELTAALQEMTRLEQTGSASKESHPIKIDLSTPQAANPGLVAFVRERREHLESSRPVCVGQY